MTPQPAKTATRKLMIAGDNAGPRARPAEYFRRRGFERCRRWEAYREHRPEYQSAGKKLKTDPTPVTSWPRSRIKLNENPRGVRALPGRDEQFVVY